MTTNHLDDDRSIVLINSISLIQFQIVNVWSRLVMDQNWIVLILFKGHSIVLGLGHAD